MPAFNSLSLRRKFGLLALIYILAISVNLLVSCFCIILYFRSAFNEPPVALPLPQPVSAGSGAAVAGPGLAPVEPPWVDQTRRYVFWVLIGQAGLGLGLGLSGLVLVRRWVLRPVSELTAATRELARGNLAYRLQPASQDEIGLLAADINAMAATVVETQNRVVERERLGAAGELVGQIARRMDAQLNEIRAMTDVIIRHADEPHEVLDFQQRVGETIDRFAGWLRDLQDSLSPLVLNPSPCPLTDMLQGVCAALEPLARQRGVRVAVEMHPGLVWVNVDRLHLEQAVVALLTNAIQASRAGQEVRIRARPDAGSSETWALSVEDQGVGIPVDLHEKVFLPHFSTSRNGQGLGLAMADKVVRLHGGRLTLESEPGRGSRFIAKLPLPQRATVSSSVKSDRLKVVADS